MNNQKYLPSMSRNELPALIVRLYGNQRAMADELGVTAQTVTNWVRKDPAPLLRHAPQITATREVTFEELVEVVNTHKEALR